MNIAVRTPAIAADNLDAELLELGRQFRPMAAQLRFRQREADRLGDLAILGQLDKDDPAIFAAELAAEEVDHPLRDLVNRIAALEATSIPGLMVKVEIVDWIHRNEAGELEFDQVFDCHCDSVEGVALESIARDLTSGLLHRLGTWRIEGPDGSVWVYRRE